MRPHVRWLEAGEWQKVRPFEGDDLDQAQRWIDRHDDPRRVGLSPFGQWYVETTEGVRRTTQPPDRMLEIVDEHATRDRVQLPREVYLAIMVALALMLLCGLAIWAMSNIGESIQEISLGQIGPDLERET